MKTRRHHRARAFSRYPLATSENLLRFMRRGGVPYISLHSSPDGSTPTEAVRHLNATITFARPKADLHPLRFPTPLEAKIITAFS